MANDTKERILEAALEIHEPMQALYDSKSALPVSG